MPIRKKQSRRLRIAIIAPSVFPCVRDGGLYGFEFVLSHLADGLDQFYDVTLIAPKGSLCGQAKVFETIDPPNQWGNEEERAFEKYASLFDGGFDLVIDCSHKKLSYRHPSIPVIGPLMGIQTVVPQYRNYSCFVTHTEWHQADTLNRFGAGSRVIHLSPDPDYYPFEKKKEPFVVVFGALQPHKGALEFLRVWPKKARLKLIIAGQDSFGIPKEYVDQVKAECEAKGADYLGTVGIKKKTELLSKASLVCLPMLRPEAWSVAAIEAMLYGTPVITVSNKDGVPATDKYSTVADLVKSCLSKEMRSYSTPAEVRHTALNRWGFDKMIALYKDAITAVTEGRLW